MNNLPDYVVEQTTLLDWSFEQGLESVELQLRATGKHYVITVTRSRTYLRRKTDEIMGPYASLGTAYDWYYKIIQERFDNYAVAAPPLTVDQIDRQIAVQERERALLQHEENIKNGVRRIDFSL